MITFNDIDREDLKNLLANNVLSAHYINQRLLMIKILEKSLIKRRRDK